MRKLLAGTMGAVVVLVWGGLGLMPGRAEAQVKWRVENYGVDSPTCGTLATPCRSITQAIANANAGDIVSVGPGRYGDLDGDGTLASLPGEEGAACPRGFCLLYVNKRLTIRSTQGAGATVVDAGGARLDDGVLIDADGVVFGQQDTGFTVTGRGFGAGAGIDIVGSPTTGPGPSNVSVSGNMLVRNNLQYGILLRNTSGSKVVGNLVSGEEGFIAGILVTGATDASVTSNVVTQSDQGFSFQGSSVVATGNVATGTRQVGFRVSTSPATAIVLSKNTAAGNLGPGIDIHAFFGPGGSATMAKNNVYGNDTTDANCGLVNNTDQAIDASNNFWGAASGPGPDPADEICNIGASTTTFVPFATVPFPIPIGLAGK